MANSRLFALVVALNQLVAAILFFPWIKPRETVCGLMGRWSECQGVRGAIGKRVCPVLEFVFHKEESCIEIYRQEEQSREILY